MTDSGSALQRAIKEHGYSLRRLARESNWDLGYLSHVIHGQRRGSYHLFRDLDRILGTGGTLAALWVTTEGLPLARALAAAAAASVSGTDQAGGAAPTADQVLASWDTPTTVPAVGILTAAQAGLSEIEHLEAVAEMFRKWDHEHGGGVARRAAAGQLADIADLLAEPHPEPLRRRLLRVASRLAIIVAHMSADAGLDAHAARYLDLALDAAREGQDSDMGGRAASAIARRLLDTGRPREAVTLLRHARASLSAVPSATTALMYTTEAWSAAALGDYDTVAPCLDQAATLAAEGGLVGPAEVAGVAGACYETLAAVSAGRKQATAASEAHKQITVALGIREAFYVRSRVLDLTGLARVRLIQGEPDEAAVIATGAIDMASGLRSQRVARRFHALAITALDQYPSAPGIPELADTVKARLPVI